MKKVLIIGLSCLGDMLLLTPAIRAIREKYPAANFSILVGPRAKESVENNPWFSEVIIWDKKSALSERSNLIKSLKAQHFDLIVDFRNTLLPFFIGAKKRITFFWKELFSKKNKIHEAERRLKMLPSFLPIPKDKTLFFPITEEDRLSIQRTLKDYGIGPGERLIVLNPGANWEAKRWRKEGFAEVSDRLAKEYNVRIIIIGGKRERDLAEKIKGLMKIEAINLAGKTTLGELAALLEKSSLLITNDTGPMHLASAVKCPTVAIYGPGNWLRYGPYENRYKIVHSNLRCSPCNVTRCKRNFLCMKLIKVSEVLRAAESLLR